MAGDPSVPAYLALLKLPDGRGAGVVGSGGSFLTVCVLLMASMPYVTRTRQALVPAPALSWCTSL